MAFRRSFVLALLPTIVLAACVDDGISFSTMKRCRGCEPGLATRGVVLNAGLDATSAVKRASGGLFMTQGASGVYLDASFAPRRGITMPKTYSAFAIRDDDVVAMASEVDTEVRFADPEGGAMMRVAGGNVVGYDETQFFFSGNELVFSAEALPSAFVGGVDLPAGRFVAVLDSTAGGTLEVFTEGHPFASATTRLASATGAGTFLAVMPGTDVAALGITTPASQGAAAGVVLHTFGATDRLVAWVSAPSAIELHAAAMTPDHGFAIAGRSHDEPFVLQQTNATIEHDRAFVAIVNPAGSVRWIFAVDDASVESIRTITVSPVDASVFVQGIAGDDEFVARLDTAGLGWFSPIHIGPGFSPGSGRLLGVTKTGNVLYANQVHQGGDDGSELPGTVSIAGVDVMTGNGLGVFELVR